MGDAGKTVHVRLSPRLRRKLEELHSTHYAGLPLSTIAKLLLADQLKKSEETILEIIQEQIRTPNEDPEAPKSASRIPLNTQKQRHRR